MKNTFRQAVQSGIFTISAELTLDSGSRADDVRRQAGLPGPLVDGIQVNDNPPARTQMSALAASSLLLQAGVNLMSTGDPELLAEAIRVSGLRP